MSKTIVKQIPDEEIYLNFEDWIDFNGLYADRMVIYGNRNFCSFGDDTLIQIIKGDYYDDDLMEIERDDGTCYDDTIGYDYDTDKELAKVSGKKGWTQTTIRGYSQGDWQDVWYVSGEVTPEELKEIEVFYMGKYSEFSIDDDYNDLIPHDVVWKGKKAICDYLGLTNYDEVEVYDSDDNLIE